MTLILLTSRIRKSVLDHEDPFNVNTNLMKSSLSAVLFLLLLIFVIYNKLNTYSKRINLLQFLHWKIIPSMEIIRWCWENLDPLWSLKGRLGKRLKSVCCMMVHDFIITEHISICYSRIMRNRTRISFNPNFYPCTEQYSLFKQIILKKYWVTWRCWLGC